MRDLIWESARGRDAYAPGARRIFLPVSGGSAMLAAPTGDDDLLLAEGRPDDPALALALVERLGRGRALADWATLPATDIDVLIVRMRQIALGDRIVADVVCANPACGTRFDISFGLDAYLAHNCPKKAPFRARGFSVEACPDDSGWYLAESRGAARVNFRLPTIGDIAAATAEADPAGKLAESCVRPSPAPKRLRALAERAMEALAPPLSGPIGGNCPHCGAAIAASFEARVYCLRELRERARFIYDDIDALAERYHWSEQDILALPGERRRIYAERARQARAT
jgi:hypothetical protein